MKRWWIICSVLFSGLAIAQRPDTAKISTEKGDQILLSRLGTTRIYLKDNTIKKDCRIKEIKEYWIVYVKNGSLHDMNIDKIKMIELDDEAEAIYFDNKNRPILKKVK